MNVLYAGQPLAQSIFLAGPSPRDPKTPSWRPEALRILEALKFPGTVFVPEPETGSQWDYDNQICWEWEGLGQATCVAFWVPRELAAMPAFTTNVEFGLMVAGKKTVLGYPFSAPKMGYLRALAVRHQVPIFHTLEETLRTAVAKAANPCVRLSD